MKIALIGYGRMGHAVERVAESRGHEVVCTVDSAEEWEEKAEELRGADVAVEFSTPSTAVENIRRCWSMGLAVVCGTTGWDAQRESMRDECTRGGHTLFAASNFSIGMNIMFEVNRRLARLTRGRGYRASISEVHHVHKLDAPSGTALELRRQMGEEGYAEGDVEIGAKREGEVPGIHSVVYDGAVDKLTLTHEAYSREGLALGATLAAEFAAEHKGWLTMGDMLS